MSSGSYQRIPTSPSSSRPSSPRISRDSTGQEILEEDDNDAHRPLRASVQAEFNRPPPAWWKRAGIILFMLVLGWLSIRLGTMKKSPQIIYASRYSEEFKYRPAASPVITEYLKDGRIRLRGAQPGGIGVREEDMPRTPAQKASDEKKRIQEARDAAREKLGLRKGKKKSKKNKSRGVKTEI
ncbi:hypothetical protein BD324DRAFT_611806 [Kockovaella imperatae]|uniref:Uncharacterized protein n=1 Tax=Kockovaella imperatae TaxID=4999 RepID=A0A1Y1URK5_9TREE|nr:hypothetical protein BD324DRAFT_611806 [Kockovaella imperatae]ORX40693.1 hypothetical protein BD324DRAFT_611806 [Kockovaella imperatae]